LEKILKRRIKLKWYIGKKGKKAKENLLEEKEDKLNLFLLTDKKFNN